MPKNIFITAFLLCLVAISPALAQDETPKYPQGPATILFRTTCRMEAIRNGLREPDRSAFMSDCHAQRIAARNQATQVCRQAARDKHFWGLARHKFIKKCVAQTKSFVVQPRTKAPLAPVFSPNP
jgi:hypothetical protein